MVKRKTKTKRTTVIPQGGQISSTPPGPLTDQIKNSLLAEVQAAAAASLAFLKARQTDVAAYVDFDVFVDREEDNDRKRGQAIEHHLVQVRAALAAALWQRQVFLGVEVIDRLLFDVVHSSGQQILTDFLDTLFKHGVPAPGLVVYPLHSFGVLGFGLFAFVEKTLPEIVIQGANVAITAQTNSKADSVAFLERAAVSLGVTRAIDRQGIDHYFVSRPLGWFENNPLMVVAMSTTTSGYYENQFIYVLKLKLSTALVMMLSVMGDQPDPDERLRGLSTKRVNNWQTLDIKHYLVFEPLLADPARLVVRCVPMNVAQLQLAELSDLNADIDPVAWSRRKAVKKLEAIRVALEQVEAGYLQHHVLGERKKVKARVYRKLLDSIDYFRRSFSASADDRAATVSLAIAFETLLMDKTMVKITATLHRRVALALKGVRGVRKYRAAVVELFKARGAIVHSGRAEIEVDLVSARRAYIESLIAVTGKLGTLSTNADRPFGRMLGDVH